VAPAAWPDDAALRAVIEERLRGTEPGGDPFAHVLRDRTEREVEAFRQFVPAEFSRAAVLVPIVERPEGLTVLLTQRATHLKHHPGQISFPGGRVESQDLGPLEAALRETEEEIGLDRSHVTPVGYLCDHAVISGYVVTPVVGFVRPGFTLELDLTEVDEVFEVPLAFVLDPAHHVPRERRFAGFSFIASDIPYQDRNIWGATASMLLTLTRLLERT
jgi:8-oxo-dGTP pyrophosphatase MutT (NUDIX family)